jgi:hypothetical protein
MPNHVASTAAATAIARCAAAAGSAPVMTTNRKPLIFENALDALSIRGAQQ